MATTAGSLTLTKLEDGHMTVTGERTTTVGARVIDATLDAEYRWDEASVTIVKSTRTRTAGELTATLVVTDLHWLRSDSRPESGSIAWTNRGGVTRTITFSRDDAGDIQVMVEDPKGKKSFAGGEFAAVR